MSKNRIVSLLLPVALLVVASGIIVAACGANQTQTTGSTATPAATYAAAPTQSVVKSATTPASATPLATKSSPAPSAASQPTTGTQQAPGNVQNCGKIALSPLHRFEDAGLTQQAGACFWQAFQQCRAATLAFQSLGVDTTTNHTFLIQPKAGGCAITDSVSHAVAPRPPTVTNYSCTGLVNANGALRFTSCGTEGDVIVPLVQ